MKKIIGFMLIVSLCISMFPLSNVSANADDKCFEDLYQARKPRPSGYIGQDGKHVEYDYSNTPDPKNQIFICVNGQILTTDVPVAEEQGSTLIPMRALLEALNADISWDNTRNEVTAKVKDKTIKLQVDNPVATVNGQSISMNIPARMKQGRVLVPVRFVSEQLNCAVVWQPGSGLIKIFTHPELSVQVLNKTTANSSDDYYYSNYFRRASRYLLENKGQLNLIESRGEELRIQQFTPSFIKTKELTIKNELSEFGGAHVGEDGYYYVIYGEHNMEESDTKSVYSIVKYDPTWAKVAQLDLKDVYVTKPFDASNLTMDSYQGKLVVYSARKRYLTKDDGLHHQSNIVFQINMKDMKLLYAEGQWPRNHVSHSFANYVRFDGSRIVYADHGDAYPRSIVLQVEQNEKIIKEIDLLRFPGKIGDNYTGAYLGGLEVASDNYLVVGSSVSLTEQYGQSKVSNLFLGVVSKRLEDANGTQVNWITDYAVNSSMNIVETHIAKINDNKFVLLWTESDRETSKESLFYMVVDGTGKVLHKKAGLEGVPSPGNMAPLVQGNKLIWYNYNDIYQEKHEQDGIEIFTLQVD